MGAGSPVIFAPGEAGALVNTYARMYLIDKGTFACGTQNPHYKEFHFSGKILYGRYIFTYTPLGDGGRGWMCRKPKEQRMDTEKIVNDLGLPIHPAGEKKSEFARLLESDGYLRYCVGSLFTKSKILDIAKYRPFNSKAMQLKDDFRTLGYWYYTMSRGRTMTVKRDDEIVGLTKEMVIDLMEKVMIVQCRKKLTVYHPTSMKNAARELFEKARARMKEKGIDVPIKD